MSLKQTQRWLQSAITSPSTPSGPDRHILPSTRLTPAERVEVYRDLYPARLVSALKLDYPLLCQYLGGPVFTQLALFYAQAHPSRSFTLNEFGRNLPDFLPQVGRLPRPSFVRDLALFERACSDVFHEAEAAPLTAEAIAQAPVDAWDRARLQTIPALRLLSLNHPVWRYAEGETTVRRRASFAAIYRHNYDVRWLPLTAASFAVLTALAQHEPLAQALSKSRGPVQLWFRNWMAAGLFHSIQFD
jgi:hypothetical protein